MIDLNNIYTNAVRTARREDGAYRTNKEKLAKKRVDRKLKVQYKYVDNKLKNLEGVDDERELVTGFVNIIASIPEKEGIAEIMNNFEGNMLDRGAEYKINSEKLGEYDINWDTRTPQAEKFLATRYDKELRDAFNISSSSWFYDIAGELNIHGSTQKQLFNNFTKVIEGSLSVNELRKVLKSDYVFTDRRADFLTYKGLAEAYAYGQQEVMTEFKAKNPQRIVIKRWVDVGDNQVTPECRANTLQGWITFDSLFKSGDKTYPRQSHPGVCRCNVVSKILSPDENLSEYINRRDGDRAVTRKVSGNDYPINKRENDYLNAKKIPTIEQTKTYLDGRGAYDPDSNILTIKRGLAEDTKMQTFLHEVGHAFDFKYYDGIQNLSEQKNGFSKLISDGRYKHGLSKEALEVLRRRFDRGAGASSYKIAGDDIGDFLAGREVVDNLGIIRKDTGFARDYFGSKAEMFAESYMQYRLNPDFKTYAPSLTDYFDYITGLLDIVL